MRNHNKGYRKTYQQAHHSHSHSPNKMIGLMDIINMEYFLGIKIFSDNNAPITACINNTCKIFNKITSEDIVKHREEYYMWYLPKQIEQTIEKKMFSLLKNPHNINVYKKPEEYDADLEKLASHINEYNRDSILANMLNLYETNAIDYYMCYNITSACYISGILMKEFYNFIKYHMNREISRKEYDNEEEDIYYMVMKYRKWQL
jgi:hypothetical protein